MANIEKALSHMLVSILSVEILIASAIVGLDATPFTVSTLQYVAVVSRHGSRSPSETYPNDPYPYTELRFWPNGPKELTNVGKLQGYRTGQNLRERYKYFLNSQYYPDELDLQYNPFNRDYTAASVIGAGLYPPRRSQVWNPLLLWQPVIQTIREFDTCNLGMIKGLCPKFRQLYFDQTDKFNTISKDYEDLINYVSNHVGENYTVISQVMDVYDTLLMQEENGFTLPKWSKLIYPDILRTIAVPYMQQIIAGTEAQIRLGAGPELKFISDMMMKKANGTYGRNQKIYIEAAHDCTLLALLAALGHNDPDLEVRTSAYMVFELHKVQSEYVIETFYFQNGDDLNPIKIEIRGCPTPCKVSNFEQLADSINPHNLNEECQI